jgi:hypothetical protein
LLGKEVPGGGEHEIIYPRIPRAPAGLLAFQLAAPLDVISIRDSS